MTGAEVKQFGTVDIIVFCVTLLLSLVVGLYYAIKDRRKNDTINYYFGGKAMPPVPVGLSMAVTSISAFTIMGLPTETYGYGTIVIWYSLVNVIPNIVACIYYIPLLHRLGLSSIYEYLELRFHKSLRLLESFIAIVKVVFYLGTAIYLPALAMNAVTPMSLEWTIAMTSIVCIVYTTFGGMKAIVWTDTLQSIIMLAGVLALFVKATMDLGGIAKVNEALERGQRQTIWNFSLDPTLPYTFWGLMVGQAFLWCDTTCTNQSVSQRYLSCKSIKHARIAAMVSVIPSIILFGLATATGCLMYAYFEGCDPLKTQEIKKADQLTPYFVVNVFENLPGMAGLFVSAAYSGTLSTVSSGINAVGVLIMEDFILARWPKLSAVAQLALGKTIVAVFGLLCMAYALTIQHINSTIVQLGIIISGAFGGPTLAVFTIALFLPCCNTKGVVFGQLVTTIFMSWIAISGLVYGKPLDKYSFLPTSVGECTNATTINTTPYTSLPEMNTSTHNAASFRPAIQDTLLAISPLYYTMLSFFLTMILAIPASFITGANNPKKMDPKLFVPLVDNARLPERVRSFFRFGVPNQSDHTESKKELLIDGSNEDIELIDKTSHRNFAANNSGGISSACTKTYSSVEQDELSRMHFMIAIVAGAAFGVFLYRPVNSYSTRD